MDRILLKREKKVPEMDDLLIQEEITVKTEPTDFKSFKDADSDKYGQLYKKDDLIFLKCGLDSETNDIRSKINADKDTDYLFIDPDGAVDHYEEVLEGQTNTLNNSKDILAVSFTSEEEDIGNIKSELFTHTPKKNLSLSDHDDGTKLREGFTLECSFCMFTTSTERVMKNHMLEHIGGMDLDAFVEVSQTDDAYKCLFCPFSSVSSEMFKYHLKFKHIPSKESPKSQLLKPEQIFESDEEEIKEESPSAKVNNTIMLNCKNCSFQCSEIDEMNEHLTKYHPDMLLKCSECSFATFNKSAFKIHLETHSEVKPYSCSRCNFSTSRREAYLQHKGTHLEGNPYVCSECGFEAKSKQGFYKHKDKHFRLAKKSYKKMPALQRDIRLFICDECNFQARSLQGFNKHKAKHYRKSKNLPDHCFIKTEDDKYACDECEFEAKTLQGYNKHKEKHYRHSGNFPKQFYNPVSNMIIDGKRKVKKQRGRLMQSIKRNVAKKVQKSHTYTEKVVDTSKKSVLFSCDECSFATRARQAILKHKDKHLRLSIRNLQTLPKVPKPKPLQEKESPGEEIYSCNECSFQGKWHAFIKHKKTHSRSSEKYPFQCSFCHYRATKKSHLLRHEMIHTGEKPYGCPHCDYRCNQASTLKVHIRRHTGETPFSCSVCPFKTFSTCLLNAHVKKHEQLKSPEYSCGLCHQLYSTEQALKKHEEVHNEPNVLTRRRRRRRNSQHQQTESKRRNVITEDYNQIVKEEFLENPPYSPLLTGLYQCSICDFQCSKFVQLSEHTISHKNGTLPLQVEEDVPLKKYFCIECNLYFGRKKEIKAHFKAVHPGLTYSKNNKVSSAYQNM